jgi:exonuclease III
MMEDFQIDILAIQETECLNQDREQILRSESGRHYYFSHTGAKKGVGFLVAQTMSVVAENFKEISPRILRLDLENIFNKKIALFSAYCPIDQKPKKC